jgi:energy-coupling factor transporter ATP-binding protein EcfA2
VSSPAPPTVGRGAVWRRWDPHIHTPGTILSSQFGGPSAWDDYLERIENATPTVQAIGITDYWSLDRYEEVLEHRANGRLPDVGLIFPNVEIRFAIGTSRGSPINAHLLISPEDEDHLVRARAFMATLTFPAHNESYPCTQDGLIRLGRAHDPSAATDAQALTAGANQFKVTAHQLSEALKNSEWARSNIVIAVAAASTDGTSGLQKDASLAAVRIEIERIAQVIFSANPTDRKFWLGQGSMPIDQVVATYDGPKPCLHGSDAHDLESVCVPDHDRFMWIKGDATFESLIQACIEPGTRAFIGPNPPTGALSYKVIDSIELKGAPWCAPSRIELNPGLIGIIGARGSGKTALADLIATGAESPASHENKDSFLRRAADHLDSLQVKLIWGDGTETSGGLERSSRTDTDGSRVQYLSQQFVEQLCSSDGGVNDELLAEIERVIFDEHSAENRAGAATFTELLDMRASRSRLAKSRSQEALASAVEQIFDQRRKQTELPALQARRRADAKTIQDDKKARLALIGSGRETRTKRLDEILKAIDAKLQQLDAAGRRKQSLDQLRDFVADVRARKTRSELADLKRRHADAGLSPEEWPAFERVFGGDVDSVLDRLSKRNDVLLSELKGAPVNERPPSEPYVAEDADLSKVPQATLTKEAERLRKQIGIDAKKADQLKALDRKIARAESALTYLDQQIAEAERAKDRIEELRAERKREYGKVFDALIDEEHQLSELYAPLAATLDDAVGALGKLTFIVHRNVDVEGWANAGEALLDLRTAGPFKGHGALEQIAREELLPAWEAGSSSDVTEAMADFRDRHEDSLRQHSPVRSEDRARFWQWAAGVARWLDGTEHISIRYGIQYDGVDIEQLSPGTRGIVLLLVYLSVDRSDDRPLIIDQPEENLDPKSIFDELVGRFREAELRRQVIIVTHNANLIVNTDADQVIVASAGPHRPGTLPMISYTAGGLEEPLIRRDVCEILEGGEQAFKDRARRLRVHLPR